MRSMQSFSSSSSAGSLLFLASVATSTGLITKLLTTIRIRSKTTLASTERTNYWLSRDEDGRFLEEVEGNNAVNWVKQQNSNTEAAFGDPKTDALYGRILSILDSKDKIPHIRRIGDSYYNYWTDEANPRGIWRRTSLENFRNLSIEWEQLLDVDALGKVEGESWVWAGHSVFHSKDPKQMPRRTLVSLSKGGSDAKTLREFDLATKTFVGSQGFNLPEPAKSRVSWLDEDTVLIGTNFDGVIPGCVGSLTDSGYPRLVCEWRRGTPLSEAKVVFEGEKSDVAVSGYTSMHRGHWMEWRRRNITFYTSKSFVRFDGESDWHALPIQDDAQIGSFADQLLITLRSSWEFRGVQYSAGAVLAIGILDLLASSSDVAPVALFAPEPRISLDGLTVTLNYVIVVALENVKSRITFWKYDDVLKAWSNDGCEASASIRGISLAADDDDRNDLVWLTFSTFLTPSSLSLMDARRGAAGILEAMTAPVKTLPAQFDSSGLEEQQGFATSKDGEQIPYFLVRKKGGAPKETPCLLYGYGGFEISLLPSYLGAFGAAWLEKGFTYVIANIRGGGEFGPDWHKAALQTNRNKAYEDFIAVAEDLVSKGIASNQHLGIRGGSNGGLLMGNMYVMRPDLFKAVVCQVPLLDMRRYNKLLAGASWMAEYGNPDTDDWSFLERYSAYHNLDHTGKTEYPALLLATSMKDDRVHPYHARAFRHRLQTLSVEDAFYYENIEGGHAGAADSKQQAYVSVLYIRFLEKYLR